MVRWYSQIDTIMIGGFVIGVKLQPNPTKLLNKISTKAVINLD
jgi:hypothetical protein